MTVRLSSRSVAPFIAALVALTFSGGDTAAAPPESIRDVPMATTAITREQIEQTGLAIDVLATLNAVRANPAGLANSMGSRPTLRGIGAADWNEARSFLNAQTPLPPLTYSPALSDIAVIHARDIGAKGLISHTGSDGSTLGVRARGRGIISTLSAEELSFGQTAARNVILQFIVDPSVPGRPHRKDLFNPVFTLAGVGCAAHSQLGQVCVVNLSNPFMVQPPPLSLPPTTSGYRFDCPAGTSAAELDAWRSSYVTSAGADSTLLAGRSPIGYPNWRENVASANETAYQALTNPAALNLNGTRLDVPRNLGLGFGYCAPAVVTDSPAPVPPPSGAAKFCWYDAKTGRRVSDLPYRADGTISSWEAVRPDTGERLHLGQDGVWIDNRTGLSVQSFPYHAEPGPDENHAYRPDTGDHYYRAPCTPAN